MSDKEELIDQDTEGDDALPPPEDENDARELNVPNILGAILIVCLVIFLIVFVALNVGSGKKKDKSPEEIIDLMTVDIIKDFENTRCKYGNPGYTGSISVSNINVKLYGGNINYLGEPMPENALFDIASMSKFYTQVVAYNLMKEGLLHREDKIKDLDNRFVNLENITVDDILTFGVSFMTDGRISDKKTIEEAMNTLFHIKVVETGKWNYNDMGLMIMKEVMERLTKMSYPELVEKYILNPLNLHETHIIVPQDKFKLLTGTPNFKEGHINDMTANAVGGYSGHAGIFASSDDLVKLGRGVKKIVPHLEDAYTPGKLNSAIGRMGNVYTTHVGGFEKTFIPQIEPLDTFAIAGSTRVNMATSLDSTYNILFNPSSMSIEEAKERVRKINEEREKNGKALINPVKEYQFDRDGKLIKYQLIDPRMILPASRVSINDPLSPMESAISHMSKTILKLRFYDYILKNYEHYLKDINVIKDNNKNR